MNSALVGIAGKSAEKTIVLSLNGNVNTPQKARDEARKLGGTARILVDDGIYPLPEPLLLNGNDSGTVWTAAPGSKAVFCGGEKIACWMRETLNGKTVWTARLAPGRRIRGLWAGEKRRERAYLPRNGWYRFTGVPEYTPSKMLEDGPLTVNYFQDEIRHFHNLEDVEIVALEWWCESHLRIAGLNPEKHEVTFRKKPLRDMRGEDGRFARYRICNVYEALDSPGDWYYDRKSGKLTYLPEEGETMEATEVFISDLSALVHIQGTAENPATGIRFENISFQYCGWEQPADMPDSHQAAVTIPGAIRMEYARDCVLYRCRIAHTTSAGIEIGTGCHANRVAACRIYDLGAGGVKIMHEKLENQQGISETCFSSAAPVRMCACVTDCEIFDGGHDFRTACGILIGNAGCNRILHNEIHDFPYTGISFGWIWGFHMAASRGGQNLIEFNHIHHINDGVLSDNGGIYSLGPQPGSRIIGNYIHDIGCYFYGGSGIYPDQGSSGLLCRNNLVRNVSGTGFNVHFARFLKTENNVFLGMKNVPVNFGRSDLSFENVFSGNVISSECGDMGNCRVNPVNHKISNCLVKRLSETPLQWPGGSLEALAGASQNWDGCAEEEFSVDEKSFMPENAFAAKIGFRPFDFRDAGVRNEGRFPDDFSEYPLPAPDDCDIVESEISGLAYSKMETEWRISFSLVLRNLGRQARSGGYRIYLVNDLSREKIVLAEPRFELPPNAADTVPLEIVLPIREIPELARQCWIKAEGDDEIHVFSSASVFLLPPPPKMLPSYPAGFSAAAPRLRGLDCEILEEGRHSMLQGKCFLTGDVLVVAADVHDPAIRVNECCIWGGSVVELFLAAAPGAAVQQFALVPPHHGNFRDIRSTQGDLNPRLFSEGLSYETAVIRDGWRFLLKMPLKKLEIDPAFFCFDLICRTSSNIPMHDYARVPLWGSLIDYASSYYLAPLTAVEEAVQE